MKWIFIITGIVLLVVVGAAIGGVNLAGLFPSDAIQPGH